MPTKSDADRRLHHNLTAASAKLRETGAPDLAEAVDQVLAPGGWHALRRLENAATAAPNFSIPMRTADRDTAKRLSEKAGESLTAIVEKRLTDFVAGTFDPRVARATRNSGAAQATSNLNMRPNPDLVQQVRSRVDELNASGRSPKLSAAGVARAAIEEHYQLGQYKPAAKTK
ncbi:hypothetical protein [Streptomyces fradiae]|uniref:hypothetical protein n=1 Tax=Streptomyces fradiae TaxID=1906 RepID=UPI0036FC7F6F